MLAIDRETFKSPNYDRDVAGRPILMQPRAIVLHSGEGTRSSDLGWLCNPKSKAGAHYYVCRDGTTYGLMPDNHQAWHAGDSLLAGIDDWNSFAIGVETEHTRGVHKDYPGVQQQALRALCRDLIARYGILAGFIQSHRNIAKHRITNKRDDPRDWPEVTLRAWVALLYQPPIAVRAGPTPDAPHAYRVKAPHAVLTARRPDAPLAEGPDDGMWVLQKDDPVDIGNITGGWAWIASGIGFVPLSYLERA